MAQQQTENAIHEMFPYLIVRDANAAIEFYKRVFGTRSCFVCRSQAVALATPN